MAEENKQVNNESVKEEIEKYKKQAEEYLNGWKRAKADYLNLKKEMEAQNKEIKEWMSKILLLPLLNILDGLDKAFGEVPNNLKNDQWVKGIEGIKKQMEDYLKSQGIEPMVVKGEKFDPLNRSNRVDRGRRVRSCGRRITKGILNR